MNALPCPSEMQLIEFVDEALSPEELARIRTHAQTCSVCRMQVDELRLLIADMAAPLAETRLDSASPFDAAAEAAAVLERVDALPAARPVPSRASRFALVSSGLALAAGLALLALPEGTLSPGSTDSSEFKPRGASEVSSLRRDVGLEVLVQEQRLRPLRAGEVLAADAPLSASWTNLSSRPAHLLLFAVDSKATVHWIAPRFTDPQTDPAATSLTPSVDPQVLSSAVVFDDLAAGPVQIYAVISQHPTHVSQIEALDSGQLNKPSLEARFPNSETRVFELSAKKGTVQ